MRPLSHIKVVELAGLAPVPFCGLLLADFGAKVIRVENIKQGMTDEALSRGKRSMWLDLKQAGHVSVFKKLVKEADVLLDPFRPGVLEKWHLSPAELHRDNPRLIVARLTGYGQPRPDDPPLVARQRMQAGHDINYLGLSGVLSNFGSADTDCPQPPVNIVADFAGGGLLCAMAVVVALMSRDRTGRGEVIDCSMTLGSAYLSSFLWSSRQHWALMWPHPDRRGVNMLDGGAPFYRCYRTGDDKYIAVGAIEPQFYERFLQLVGIPAGEAPEFNYSGWPALSQRIAAIIMTRSQDEWIESANAIGDCCVTRVLDLDEAARFWTGSYSAVNGEPLPHPIFGGVTREHPAPATRPVQGADTETVLRELGLSDADVTAFMKTLRGKL